MDFTIQQTQRIHENTARIVKKKMKMKDFYEKSGVSSSLFSQYGTGRTPASMLKVCGMAKALGVDVSVLLEGSEKQEKPATPDQGDGQREEWADAWDRASPEARALALSALRLGEQKPSK